MRQPLRRAHPLSGITHGNLGSDVRPRPGFSAAHVKTRRTVQDHCGRATPSLAYPARAARHQHLRQRCAFEKAERRTGMKFHIHRNISVVNSDQVPATRARVISDAATQSFLLAQHNIPFLAAPLRMRPPCPTRLPGPGCLVDGQLPAIEKKRGHARILHFHSHRAGRTQHTQRRCAEFQSWQVAEKCLCWEEREPCGKRPVDDCRVVPVRRFGPRRAVCEAAPARLPAALPRVFADKQSLLYGLRTRRLRLHVQGDD